MQDFRNLAIWRQAHGLVLEVYRATARFPRSEQFGLASQMRRSAASVPTNIAEGCGRGSDADFARFLQIALGSATELEYQLLLAIDLGYLEANSATAMIDRVQTIKQMTSALLRKLSPRPAPAKPKPKAT
jgi:four helix bundle protein